MLCRRSLLRHTCTLSSPCAVTSRGENLHRVTHGTCTRSARWTEGVGLLVVQCFGAAVAAAAALLQLCCCFAATLLLLCCNFAALSKQPEGFWKQLKSVQHVDDDCSLWRACYGLRPKKGLRRFVKADGAYLTVCSMKHKFFRGGRNTWRMTKRMTPNTTKRDLREFHLRG